MHAKHIYENEFEFDSLLPITPSVTVTLKGEKCKEKNNYLREHHQSRNISVPLSSFHRFGSIVVSIL